MNATNKCKKRNATKWIQLRECCRSGPSQTVWLCSPTGGGYIPLPYLLPVFICSNELQNVCIFISCFHECCLRWLPMWKTCRVHGLGSSGCPPFHAALDLVIFISYFGDQTLRLLLLWEMGCKCTVRTPIAVCRNLQKTFLFFWMFLTKRKFIFFSKKNIL